MRTEKWDWNAAIYSYNEWLQLVSFSFILLLLVVKWRLWTAHCLRTWLESEASAHCTKWLQKSRHSDTWWGCATCPPSGGVPGARTRRGARASGRCPSARASGTWPLCARGAQRCSAAACAAAGRARGRAHSAAPSRAPRSANHRTRQQLIRHTGGYQISNTLI